MFNVCLNTSFAYKSCRPLHLCLTDSHDIITKNWHRTNITLLLTSFGIHVSNPQNKSFPIYSFQLHFALPLLTTLDGRSSFHSATQMLSVCTRVSISHFLANLYVSSNVNSSPSFLFYKVPRPFITKFLFSVVCIVSSVATNLTSRHKTFSQEGFNTESRKQTVLCSSSPISELRFTSDTITKDSQ